MMRNEPTITVSQTGIVTVEIHGLSDALELQRSIGESIKAAIADGKTGRDNGIPAYVNGHGSHLRFQVNVSNAEAYAIGFNAPKSPERQ